ncbi:MAG: hypothetical protein AB8E87_09225 [Prochlorococcus sp.]
MRARRFATILPICLVIKERKPQCTELIFVQQWVDQTLHEGNVEMRRMSGANPSQNCPIATSQGDQ